MQQKGRVGRGVSVVLRLLVCFVTLSYIGPTLFAQETTGDIDAYVKDASGAAIPKATVEVSGPVLIIPKTITTDDAGYVHFAQLPPGTYTLTVSANSFRVYKLGDIALEVGK